MRARPTSTHPRHPRHPPRTALPRAAAGALAALIGLLGGAHAQAVDWSGIEPLKVEVFYPGQASWEWALTEKDHSGAPKFREGKDCRSCHDGEQKDIGQRIVSGEKLEPKPIAGKPGSTTIEVRTAHDGERLYFQLRWKPAPASGNKPDPETAARVTVMIGDGGVKEATRAGCWATCHDDAVGMASAPVDAKITKYVGVSRVKLARSGGGENYKPAAELDKLVQQGAFLEYWQAKLNPGQPAKAVSGYILDRRHEHEPAASSASANLDDGWWTVELSRALKAAGPTQKALAPGKTYTVGFALHDDYTDHRYHYVSFERTLVLDSGTADFVAKKQ